MKVKAVAKENENNENNMLITLQIIEFTKEILEDKFLKEKAFRMIKIIDLLIRLNAKKYGKLFEPNLANIFCNCFYEYLHPKLENTKINMKLIYKIWHYFLDK